MLLFRLLFNRNFLMKLKSCLYLLIACYSATFLRLFINNNLIVSIIGSLFFGFVLAKKYGYLKKKILFSGFFSCFTSFSGFIYFLYEIINHGEWIKFIIFFNLIILINLFTMYLGFWIGRKIT